MSFIEELSSAASSYRIKQDEYERCGINFFIETNIKRLKEEIKHTAEREEFSFSNGKRVIKGTYELYAEVDESRAAISQYIPRFSIHKKMFIGYVGTLDEKFYNTFETLKKRLSNEGIFVSDFYIKAKGRKNKISKEQPFYLTTDDGYINGRGNDTDSRSISGYVYCDYRIEF